MVLDQYVFFGVADMHDRHRDMWLDVDNMSYDVIMQERGLVFSFFLFFFPKFCSAIIFDYFQEEYSDGEDIRTLV